MPCGTCGGGGGRGGGGGGGVGSSCIYHDGAREPAGAFSSVSRSLRVVCSNVCVTVTAAVCRRVTVQAAACSCTSTLCVQT